MKSRERWAFFISGRGSNLSALLEMNEFYDPVLVLSDKPKAFGLFRGRWNGIRTRTVTGKGWAEKAHEILKAERIDRIFLVGFMRIVPEWFVQEWAGKVVNIHPSLLPKYPGLQSLQRAFAEGEDLGATVHTVIAAVDEGQSLLQKCAVKKSDLAHMSLEDAEFRVHLIEHQLCRKVISRGHSL